MEAYEIWYKVIGAVCAAACGVVSLASYLKEGRFTADCIWPLVVAFGIVFKVFLQPIYSW